MSIGHIVGTLSEPLSKGLCLVITANEPICSLVAVGVHELFIEPLVDSTIYAGISAVSLDYEKTLEHFYNIDPYNFATKVAGSLLASKAGEHVFGEHILVSTITGVAGSYLADSLYNTNFNAPLDHCKLGEDCFDELVLMPTVRSVTGSHLADSVYNSIYASNHTSPDSSI